VVVSYLHDKMVGDGDDDKAAVEAQLNKDKR
jgi:hypothetical protein